MLQLRNYQQQAIDSTLYAIEMEGKKNVVLFASVSWGKSLYLSELANQLDGKVVILVNITTLIDQIAEHLDEINVDYSILKAGYESRFDPSKKIQLVMSQTFYARYESIDFGDVSFVLQDEAQREWKTQRTTLILETLKPLARIAVSGTPYDSAGYALEGCDELIETISVSQLEEEKFTSPLKYYIPKWAEQIDYSELRRSGADYSGSAIDELINTNEYNNLVLQSMNQLNCQQKKCLVFCNSIEHSDSIAKTLNENGYSAYSYHSKNDKQESEAVFQSFKTNEPLNSNLLEASEPIKVLVSIQRLSVGFSVSDIDVGVMCSPSLVLSKIRQQYGRIQRASNGKTHGEILDLASCVSRHGFHDEEYNPPLLGNREELSKQKSLLEMPMISALVDEEPTEVTRDAYNTFVQEIQRKSKSIPTMSTDDLMAFYEVTVDITQIVHIAFEMNLRMNGVHYKENNVTWTTEPILVFLNDFPDYEYRILKSFKTRGRNIVKDKKKIFALRYFSDWMRTNPPFNIDQEPLTVGSETINDSMIPF